MMGGGGNNGQSAAAATAPPSDRLIIISSFFSLFNQPSPALCVMRITLGHWTTQRLLSLSQAAGGVDIATGNLLWMTATTATGIAGGANDCRALVCCDKKESSGGPLTGGRSIRWVREGESARCNTLET